MSSAGFIRLPVVKELTGLSRATIYAQVKSKAFPSPVPLGARSVGWVRSEVEGWIADRIAAARPEAGR